MKTMKCRIIKHDASFFDSTGKGQKMALFGSGPKTWYNLTDHEKDEDFEWKKICRYTITKSYIDFENDRVHASAPIQDKEANQLLKGGVLVVDGDHLAADKRSKLYKKD